MALVSGNVVFMLVGVVWTLLYIAYQGLSVIRKKDSAGLDVCDYMVGFGAGVSGMLLINM